MKKTFLTLLLALATSSHAYAQTSATNRKPESRKSHIFGRLVGHDGKPMPNAVVLLAARSPDETGTKVDVREDGTFDISTDQTGMIFLGFNGLHHWEERAVLMLTKPREVRVEVRLSLPEYSDDFSRLELFVQGVRNPLIGKRLEKQPDGTYSVEFETQEKTVFYRLKNLTKNGFPFTNPQAEGYEPRFGRGVNSGFASVAKPVDGKAKITFDPAKLTHSRAPAVIRFPDHGAQDESLTAVYKQVRDRLARGRQFEASAPNPAEVENLLRQITREKDPFLKTALRFNYLDWTLGHDDHYKADAALVAKALDELTPTSPLWMLRESDPADLIDKAIVASGQPKKYEGYVDRAVDSFPEGLRPAVLANLMDKARANKQLDKYDAYFNRLVAQFPNSPIAKYALSERERKPKVVVGQAVPAFSAPSLGDPSVVYTPASIKAKVYLIDFWATWCGPCIKEMPSLHRAYEKYHAKGFEILSYSLDTTREVVVNFRKERFKMPWLHAIDAQLKNWDAEMVNQFEVGATGIPEAFLVNSSGEVIAIDISGDKLEQILEKLLGGTDKPQTK